MNLIKTAFAAAGVGLLVATAPAQTFITNGLVAYYPFNGNANDASGYANNGTVVGAVLCADRFGNPNSAYNFNGTNSYISYGSTPTTQLDNVTISAWLNPASINQYSSAVSLGYNDFSRGDGFELGMAQDKYNPGNHVSGYLGGVTYVDAGSVYPSTNVWYHVVMLRRAGVTMFYVNGIQTPNTYTTTPIAPTAFTIGAGNGVRFFNGKVDDVRIYNRALASNEVQQLYQIENSVPCLPHHATATAIVSYGYCVAATVLDPGCGYTNAPLVSIQGGGGSGATATSVISNGVVTAINIISPGSGYTNAPQIIIASPPFVPTLGIAVSRVNVAQHVVLGANYILESSPDLINWTATGPQFTAQSETIVTEFVLSQTGQYFRIRQVP